MASNRTIINAWENRYLPDIFYEQLGQVNNPVLNEARIISLLRGRYADRSDVFMSGMVSISYKVPDDTARFAPEFFIAFGVPDADIRERSQNFFIWRLGKSPDFVMDLSSSSSRVTDPERKRDLYAELGVVEYWRFDPTGGELYGQPLAGERLVDGEYQLYELRVDDDGSIIGYSELLDLNFYWDGDEFDVLDPGTGMTIDPVDMAHQEVVAEREARQADRIEFEARERELLDELNHLRRQLDD